MFFPTLNLSKTFPAEAAHVDPGFAPGAASAGAAAGLPPVVGASAGAAPATGLPPAVGAVSSGAAAGLPPHLRARISANAWFMGETDPGVDLAAGAASVTGAVVPPAAPAAGLPLAACGVSTGASDFGFARQFFTTCAARATIPGLATAAGSTGATSAAGTAAGFAATSGAPLMDTPILPNFVPSTASPTVRITVPINAPNFIWALARSGPGSWALGSWNAFQTSKICFPKPIRPHTIRPMAHNPLRMGPITGAVINDNSHVPNPMRRATPIPAGSISLPPPATT